MSAFGLPVEGGLTEDYLIKGYVYKIKVKGPLLDNVRHQYPDAPDEYTGIFMENLRLDVDYIPGIYPSWVPYCMDGNPLPKSVKYFYHEIEITKHVTKCVYIFLDRKDIEISGPLKHTVMETMSKWKDNCAMMGGRKNKRKRTNKRKSKRKHRN